MNTVERESVLQQLERVIEQTHKLQLELLRLHRAMLGDEPGIDSQPKAEAADAPVAVDLPDRPTFSVKETARLLGVSRDVVYDCAQSGEILTLRLGRRLLIPRIALVRMLGG